MSIFGVNASASSGSSTTVAQSLLQPSRSLTANPVASSTKTDATSTGASTATAASASGDITSNDFLTLLVTEMKNQDPTAPTDPNSYIQQLVGVNSLQQLISINQELGTATGSASSANATTSSVTASPAS